MKLFAKHRLKKQYITTGEDMDNKLYIELDTDTQRMLDKLQKVFEVDNKDLKYTSILKWCVIRTFLDLVIYKK